MAILALEDEFDVVVVGAGSAGCAVAGRLSEDPSLNVLLLEAGGSDDVLEVQVPAGLYKVWRTRRDWNYTTEPQPGLGGRKLFWPRGKLLGGSSSINAMIYMRGVAADYDEWAKLTGDPSWSYDSVLRCLPAHGGQRARRGPLPRRRRPAAGRGPALAAPVDARRHPVRGRGRLPAQRRLQRRHHRGRRPVPGDPAARPALVGRRRLPAPRDGPAEPDRPDRRADHPRAGRGRPGHRRRVPLRRAAAHGPCDAARSCSPAARSTPRSC